MRKNFNVFPPTQASPVESGNILFSLLPLFPNRKSIFFPLSGGFGDGREFNLSFSTSVYFPSASDLIMVDCPTRRLLFQLVKFDFINQHITLSQRLIDDTN